MILLGFLCLISLSLLPYGLLHRVMAREGPGAVYKIPGLWRYYSSESFYRKFEKDFMTRQVSAHFFLRYGIYLYHTGEREVRPSHTFRRLRNSATMTQECSAGQPSSSRIRGCLILLEEHLAKAPVSRRNAAVIENNWGCFFYKKGDYESAVRAFRKAVEQSPENPAFKKNLALALAGAGREEEAAQVMRNALEILLSRRLLARNELTRSKLGGII